MQGHEGKKKTFSKLALSICFIIKERKQENVLQSPASFFPRDGRGNMSRQGQMVTYAYNHNILMNTGASLLVF